MAAGEEKGGKTLIVAMKMDTRGRELLTWSLVKVAEAGDQVIAIHVLPADAADSDWSTTSLISLIKHFEDVLAVFEGFCNLKQIELKMKLCRGSSIRKMLVHEACSVSASKLIIGTSKNSSMIRSSSLSIAKYCAKKLSRGCLVLAVNNGRIIYEKDAAGIKLTQELLQKRESIKMDDISIDTSRPSISSLLTESVESSSFDSLDNDESDVSSELDPTKGHESSMNCSAMATHEFPDRKPGCLLLRRPVLNQKLNWPHVASKPAVVKWVMRLPSRYYASSVVHPDYRRAKSDLAKKNWF